MITIKVRIGYVTNSSSSSFIVVLPHRPTTVEDMQRMLFPNGTNTLSYERYEWRESTYITHHIRTYEIAESAFNEMHEGNYAEMLNLLADEYTYDGSYEIIQLRKESSRLWHQASKISDKATIDQIRNLIHKDGKVPSIHENMRHEYYWQYIRDNINPIDAQIKALACNIASIELDKLLSKGKFAFIVEYEDCTTFGSFMEHEDVFRNVPYRRISQH